MDVPERFEKYREGYEEYVSYQKYAFGNFIYRLFYLIKTGYWQVYSAFSIFYVDEDYNCHKNHMTFISRIKFTKLFTDKIYVYMLIAATTEKIINDFNWGKTPEAEKYKSISVESRLIKGWQILYFRKGQSVNRFNPETPNNNNNV